MLCGACLLKLLLKSDATDGMTFATKELWNGERVKAAVTIVAGEALCWEHWFETAVRMRDG